MTPPVPTRGTPAGRAYNDLRNLARQAGRDPSEYFTLYVLKRFLARLGASDQAEDFVLKGGVLLAAFASRRPTRDIDLAAVGLRNDIEETERRIRRIITADLDDGVIFDEGSLAADTIRDEAA